MSILFVVESPNKAKKIRTYFSDFNVVATVGHFRDLPVDRMGVEPPDHKPEYVTCDGKAEVEKRLRAGAAKADQIYIATDPDREGEAIASHVYQCLGAKYKNKIKRVTYNEVSKKAIEAAIRDARGVDWALVKAQEARRVIDRYVGYLISPALTDKLKSYNNGLGFLSSGRVQTIALKLIVERQREIAAFKPVEHYGVQVTLIKGGITFGATWAPFPQGENAEQAPDDESEDDAKPQRLITDINQAKAVLDRTGYLTVTAVQKKTVRIAPPKPLITSSYLKTVGGALKLTTKSAMDVAQKLFEAGLITYHRTDSPVMSDDFTQEIRAYARGQNLPLPQSPRSYKAGAGSQEGHECLRVADIAVAKAETGDALLDAAYAMIWQITLQSQLADAVEDRTTVVYENASKDTFVSKGVIEVTQGWRKTIRAKTEKQQDAAEEKAAQLPEIQENEEFVVEDKNLITKKTKAPQVYTEKTLVAKLDKLNIGRPSTYGTVLERIIEQSFIERNKKLQLNATGLGDCVIQALDNRFAFLNYAYTAELEALFDKIACKKMDYETVVEAVYISLEHDMEAFDKEALPTTLEDVVRNLPARVSPKAKGRKGAKPKAKASSAPSTKKQCSPGDECPQCKTGKITTRRFETGKHADKDYMGCSQFPTCRFFQWVH